MYELKAVLEKIEFRSSQHKVRVSQGLSFQESTACGTNNLFTKKSNSVLIGYSTTQFCMRNEMNQVLALKRVADLTIKGDVLKSGTTSCTRTKYLTKFFLICFTPVSVVIKNFHSKAVCSFCHSTTNSSQANNANG